MANYISVVIKVASFSFQIAGAVILLIWVIGNTDAKIKNMCLENSGVMVGEFDRFGTHCVLGKEDLQKNAVTAYRNVVALLDVIIGYAFAIFVSETLVPNWCILCIVIALTFLILVVELYVVARLARHRYPGDVKVTDDVIPDGTVIVTKVETE